MLFTASERGRGMSFGRVPPFRRIGVREMDNGVCDYSDTEWAE